MCIRLHDDYIACDEKKIFNRIAKLFFFKLNEQMKQILNSLSQSLD